MYRLIDTECYQTLDRSCRPLGIDDNHSLVDNSGVLAVFGGGGDSGFRPPPQNLQYVFRTRVAAKHVRSEPATLLPGEITPNASTVTNTAKLTSGWERKFFFFSFIWHLQTYRFYSFKATPNVITNRYYYFFFSQYLEFFFFSITLCGRTSATLSIAPVG